MDENTDMCVHVGMHVCWYACTCAYTGIYEYNNTKTYSNKDAMCTCVRAPMHGRALECAHTHVN
jgi:hypothetical protein